MTIDAPENPGPASLVAVLAELFPKTFVAKRRQPHKPLKIGIDADLIARGILTPAEVSCALRYYINRRMYIAATAASGSRFDLDGEEVGEVTEQHAKWARRKLAHMDAAAPARAALVAAVGHEPSTLENNPQGKANAGLYTLER